MPTHHDIVIDGRAWQAIASLGPAAGRLSDEERRLLVQILDALPRGDETGPTTFGIDGPGEHPLYLEVQKDQHGNLVVRLVGEGD